MPKPHLDRLMADARAHLDAIGVSYTCPSSFQLKIGPVSYYPTTGRVRVDGEPGARPGAGLAALEAVLVELQLLASDCSTSMPWEERGARVIALADALKGGAGKR